MIQKNPSEIFNVASAKSLNRQMRLLPDNSFLSGYQHYEFPPQAKIPEPKIEKPMPIYVKTDQSRRYDIKLHEKLG